MKIRILFCLIAGLVVLTGCKKENKNKTIGGIVIDKRTNRPIAGVELSLIFWSNNLINPGPRYTARSNNEGIYQFTVPTDSEPAQAHISVKKDSLLHAAFPGSIPSPKLDTVFMEDPSYLRLIVKVTRPVPDGVRFDCALHENVTGMFSYFPFDYDRRYTQPATDTLQIPFSISRHNQARAFFYVRSLPPIITDSLVVEKIITLLPYTTTELTIEY